MKSINNPLLAGAQGKLGNTIVFKVYSYGTVITKYPDMTGIIPSDRQVEKRNRFRRAVAFAKAILKDPEQKAAFQLRTLRKQTVFQAAISEYMKGFRILDVGHVQL